MCQSLIAIYRAHYVSSVESEAVARWSVIGKVRYDSVYLTCSKKLTGSQLSPPHGTNKKLKCETKNKTSHCHEGSPVGKRNLRWEGFVEKIGFEPGVKQ